MYETNMGVDRYSVMLETNMGVDRYSAMHETSMGVGRYSAMHETSMGVGRYSAMLETSNSITNGRTHLRNCLIKVVEKRPSYKVFFREALIIVSVLMPFATPS